MSDSVLLVDNGDAERLLEMPALLDRLDAAYRALGEGAAANGPRVDVSVPNPRPGAYHRLKTMSGSLPRDGVAAVRLDSDLLRWPTDGGTVRREKVTRDDDGDLRVGAENGLVVLYDTDTAEPLLLAPDGQLQRFRVGATSALAADYLARADASSVGLLGSGFQAGAQVLGLCEVRDLDEIRVYSPTREHRESFAAEFDRRVDADVRAVAGPERAVEDADVIDAATDSLSPVIDPDWLEPGVHVTAVKKQELTTAAFERADVAVVHSAGQAAEHTVVVEGEEPIPEAGAGDRWWTDTSAPVWERIASLGAVAAGDSPPRTAPEQATLFANNVGLGVQFAAAGLLLYERAREAGAGETLPLGWFLQDIA